MIKFAVNTMLCATHYCTLPFSDGMSRSGVFITCMSEIERVKVEGAVDIFQTVKAARAQRPHMVYTTVSSRSTVCMHSCPNFCTYIISEVIMNC